MPVELTVYNDKTNKYTFINSCLYNKLNNTLNIQLIIYHDVICHEVLLLLFNRYYYKQRVIDNHCEPDVIFVNINSYPFHK